MTPAFDPATWRHGRRQLYWDYWKGPYSSLGYVVSQLLPALHRAGVELFMPEPLPEASVAPGLRDALSVNPSLTTWGVQLESPFRVDPLPVARRIRYTMSEWDPLPPDWAEAINAHDLMLVVPTEQQRELFVRDGVTLPVSVVSHGVDSDTFSYQTPAPSRHFTFGTMGFLAVRKGIDVLVQAFIDEFSRDEDARLVIKVAENEGDMRVIRLRLNWPTHPRVEFRFGHIAERELADLLATFDVGVFPSRGEGFGLGGLQTMAVGRTVICTARCGMRDYLDPAYNFALDSTLAPCVFPGGIVPGDGVRRPDYKPRWAEPSYEHLRALMRYCYEHRAEVRAKGRAAARWVRTHWTWDRGAKQLIDAIDGFGAPPARAKVKRRRPPRSRSSSRGR